VFAIDEFQQITNYPEKNTEAFLRTHIQSSQNTVFIFCGSNQKLMHEMFNSAKRPFTHVVPILTLTIFHKMITRILLKNILQRTNEK